MVDLFHYYLIIERWDLLYVGILLRVKNWLLLLAIQANVTGFFPSKFPKLSCLKSINSVHFEKLSAV